MAKSIQNTVISTNNKGGFITWNTEPERKTALSTYQTDDAQSVVRRKAQAGYLDTYRGIDTNVSVRDSFGQIDYDYFRPGEAIPAAQKQIMHLCMMAYRRVGLVRNVIDLMGDFTCQGIDIVHPTPKIQRLCRKWWERVKGKERSERIANMLYRVGTVPIRRIIAKIPSSELERLSKITGAADVEYQKAEKPGYNEIPIRYSILNPLSLEVVGDELAAFVGDYQYGLKLSTTIVNKIKNSKPSEDFLISQIPKEIIEAIQNGTNVRMVPIPKNRMATVFYKKDDWEVWPSPMIESILDDLKTLDKMRLADRAALDGVISQVRLWRLGSLDHKILPTSATISRLANMLLNNVGGGVIDLIWGPDLDLVQTDTKAYEFLGMKKYEPTLGAIYDGLGIPPTLTAAGSAGGFTNNAISLRTLIERLNYGRDALVSFWNNEFELLRQALRLNKAPQLRFSYMSLSDETAERTLLTNLADRGIISDETVLERFKENPDIERARLKRESQLRDKKAIPRKASPWHRPEYEEDLTKIALQTGSITPSEAGVELQPKHPDQKSMQDILLETKKLDIEKRNTGIPGQGRPKNSNDKTKRKQKTVKPRQTAAFAKLQMWAKEAHKEITDIITPILLNMYSKANMRQLTTAEANEAEDIKFSLLFAFSPFSLIDAESIAHILENDKLKIPSLANIIYKEMIQQFNQMFNKQPTMEDLRMLQTSVYSLLQTEYLQGDIDE